MRSLSSPVALRRRFSLGLIYLAPGDLERLDDESLGA